MITMCCGLLGDLSPVSDCYDLFYCLSNLSLSESRTAVISAVI